MLKIFHCLEQLSFSQLMSVYEESNSLNAAELYGDMDANAGLIQVEQDFYAYLRECFFKTQDAWCAVWEENGRYTCALRMEPFSDGFLLEALETAPSCRRQGYARKLMDAVLVMQGGKVYSHVRSDNLASYHLHISCGFVKISDTCVYVDGTYSDSCTTLMWGKV